jgi:hypothetical protein
VDVSNHRAISALRRYCGQKFPIKFYLFATEMPSAKPHKFAQQSTGGTSQESYAIKPLYSFALKRTAA